MSDITFETYILYGMYMVTDFDEEASQAAQFAVDTQAMFMDYMYKKGLVDQNAMQVFNGMVNYFKNKQVEFLSSMRDNIRSGNINQPQGARSYGQQSQNPPYANRPSSIVTPTIPSAPD